MKSSSWSLKDTEQRWKTTWDQRSKHMKGGPRVAMPRVISQLEANMYLPLGASIWVSNGRPELWGHMAPYRRVVSPFDGEDDEARAINLCIKKLWIQYLELFGKPRSECPFHGTVDA